MGTSYAVAFRPGDGRHLVAGCDGAVNLWDWRADRLEHQFTGHRPAPISVAFSRDGRWLASGDWQGRIHLWDPDGRGGPVRTVAESGSPISALAFRPDAGELAAASYDRRVDVWDTETGEHVRPIPQPGRRAVVCVAFGGPNGRLLATSGEDKTVHLREAATGRELLNLRGHTETVTCLAFSPDGRRLVSSGRDKTIRVWDGTPLRGDEGREEARTFSHHTNEIWSLAVRPTDGRMVVSGGFKTPATVWDPQTGAVIAEIPRPVGGRLLRRLVAGRPAGRLGRRGRATRSSTSRSSTRADRTARLRTPVQVGVHGRGVQRGRPAPGHGAAGRDHPRLGRGHPPAGGQARQPRRRRSAGSRSAPTAGPSPR